MKVANRCAAELRVLAHLARQRRYARAMTQAMDLLQIAAYKLAAESRRCEERGFPDMPVEYVDHLCFEARLVWAVRLRFRDTHEPNVLDGPQRCLMYSAAEFASSPCEKTVQELIAAALVFSEREAEQEP